MGPPPVVPPAPVSKEGAETEPPAGPKVEVNPDRPLQGLSLLPGRSKVDSPMLQTGGRAAAPAGPAEVQGRKATVESAPASMGGKESDRWRLFRGWRKD